MKDVRTIEVKEFVGQSVRLQGWLHNVRRLGGVNFINNTKTIWQHWPPPTYPPNHSPPTWKHSNLVCRRMAVLPLVWNVS